MASLNQIQCSKPLLNPFVDLLSPLLPILAISLLLPVLLMSLLPPALIQYPSYCLDDLVLLESPLFVN